MSDINFVQLSGWVGADPTSQTYKQDDGSFVNWAYFSIHVERYNPDGDNFPKGWFKIACRDHIAKSVLESIKKGTHVSVTGEISNLPWGNRVTDKEGNLTDKDNPKGGFNVQIHARLVNQTLYLTQNRGGGQPPADTVSKDDVAEIVAEALAQAAAKA